MSSLRNVVQRRNHKERAQPHARQKLGILEKHKDYTLRAKDYNDKQARLKTLRQKAAERNPDEFHFAMMNSQTDSNGRKIASRGNKNLSTSVVRLLKTQDAGYLGTVARKTSKDIERLEQTAITSEVMSDQTTKAAFQELEGWPRSSRVLFGDDMDRINSLAAEGGNVEAQADRSYVSTAGPHNTRASDRQSSRLRSQRRAKLKALKSRRQDLLAATIALDQERAQIKSSVGGISKAGNRFKLRGRKR